MGDVAPGTSQARWSPGGHRRVAAMLAIALSVVLAVAAAPPAAAVSGWIGPTRISDKGSGNVALVLDHTGTPHIAFTAPNGIYYMTRRSGSWVRERITSSANDWWARIALDGAGHVHITFHRVIPNCEVCPTWPSKGIYHATNASGSWAVARITSGAGDYDASVVARGATVDVAFARDGVGIVHMRHVVGMPGWTSEVAAHERDLSYRWAPARPALAVADNGDLGIAYAAPGPDAEGGDLYGGVKYATTRGGPGWTRSVVTAADDYNVNLAIDSAGVPHLVFVRDRNFSRIGVFYATLGPSGWTRELMAPFGNFPYVTTDAARHPAVAWANEFGVVISWMDGAGWAHKPLSNDYGYSPDVRFAPDGSLRIAYAISGVFWLRQMSASPPV